MTTPTAIPEVPHHRWQPPQGILPLQAGDHLTAEEFERRYQAMPGLKKAELIAGVVYMPSPVTIEDHGSPELDMATWIGTYRAHTPGTQGGENTTVRMGLRGQPQPDALLRILPSHGGRTTTMDRYVVGLPEWIGEVAASSASYDLHEKFDEYQRHGALEYMVWRVWDQAIDWFFQKGEGFERLPLVDGIYQSPTFLGLWLDPLAMTQGDMIRVLQVLHQGLASTEHARFCEKLRLAAGK